MKLKLILFIILMVFAVGAVNAKTWKITVSSYQFNPANVTANVGDIIEWDYVNGFHTTTSISVPAGAASWDAPMQSAGATFQYIVSLPGQYQYHCSIHPAQMTGIITVNGALPVVLSRFNVTASKIAGIATITWSTASEVNTEHFIVKKSINSSVFTEVARIKAAGNSALTNNYSVTDNNVGTAYKYIYYVLEVVDKDGASTLSPVQKFVNNSAVKKLVTQISPNPVSKSEHLMFQFNADQKGEMLVQLYDNNGKFIKDDKMYATPGLNNGHFHMANVPSGVYTVVFSLDGLKESYRIMVQ